MKTYRSLFHYILLSTVAMLFFAGCKSSQKVATVEAGEAKAHAEFFDSMQQQQFAFHTLSARLQADLRTPKNELGSRVDLKIVKDSALQLSVVPFLGVEMFRIEMNKDSILVVDRMNKQYVLESFANMKGQTPITFNFYNLQALFVNHIFLPGEKGINAMQYNRFQLKQEGSMAEVKVKDAMGLFYTFKADGEEKLLSTYVADAAEKYALIWNYTDFRLQEEQPFPMLMDVQVWTEGKSAGEIKLAFSRIQTDVPVKIDFIYPDKYKRITFAQILKSITNK